MRWPLGNGGFVLSARARVLGWLLVVVGVAVLASVLVSRQLLLAEVEENINTELTHEAEKFQNFADASDIDPETGRPYTSADQLLRSYMERNLPDEGEAFFSLVNGHPSRRSPGKPFARLDKDDRFIAHIRSASRPTTGTWTTAAGQADYATLPVHLETGGGPPGTLVVVEFRRALQEQADHLVQLMLTAALASLALAGLVGWAVAGRVLAPVRAMRLTAERITDTDLSDRIEVTGTDDVAALARTFNSMLDRLQSAFTGQRQFLDDAGHELRTPITVIRGHLELMGDNPADRDATVPLVLNELDRMARIVNDLILLAKAEQPDFLNLEEVDLADLAVDALAKAHALGDRQWTLDAFADRQVLADGQRLTQAVMQLAENAVRHTSPGDVIAIGTAVRPAPASQPRQAAPETGTTAPATEHADRALVWVRDTGTGIAESERHRIFQRFYHGADRHRVGERAGLGLAIVARIAAAHHGRVELSTSLGHGSTFTLDLPLLPADRSHPMSHESEPVDTSTPTEATDDDHATHGPARTPEQGGEG
jgi:signal transduction histidine kinase